MEQVNELREQLQEVIMRLQTSEAKHREYENQIANLNQRVPIQTETQYIDVETQITSGDQIQLESYKSIPEFSGKKGQYRSWRNQVVRRMKMIENYKTHHKYEAALGIIRAKITSAASDVLTNNKTSYNIDAIISRLDASYADQRPLYVVEAEMMSIKQLNKTLQEFYDSVNQALNLVISKIVMTYTTADGQKSLVEETQQKAIRTFIVGLKSQATRNILYSHKPKTLAEAFTTAQTVYFDNQFLQLDQNRNPQQQQRPQQRPQQWNAYPKNSTQQENSPANFKMNVTCNQSPQQQPNKQSTTPMNEPQRMKYPNKFQKLNQLSDPNEGYEGDICGGNPDDLISNTSHETIESNTASTFLFE